LCIFLSAQQSEITSPVVYDDSQEPQQDQHIGMPDSGLHQIQLQREHNYEMCWKQHIRGAGKSLARPNSRCILFDGENISFDASLVIYI
jgi:hypothetical protein